MVVAAKPLQPQANPIPLGLRQDLPDPWMPWKMSDRVFQALAPPQADSPYKKTQLLPTDAEWRFVGDIFKINRPVMELNKSTAFTMQLRPSLKRNYPSKRWKRRHLFFVLHGIKTKSSSKVPNGRPMERLCLRL